MSMGGAPVFALSIPKSPTGRSSDSSPQAITAGLSSLASALFALGGYPDDDKGGAFFTAEKGTEANKNKTSSKTTWEAVGQKDAMYIKMEMPGVSKEDVKVYLDGILLVIKGETKPDPELEGDKKSAPKIYSAIISLVSMMSTYKTAEMKAEMKNGVLKVKIPKIEEMEREDIVNVKVD